MAGSLDRSIGLMSGNWREFQDGAALKSQSPDKLLHNLTLVGVCTDEIDVMSGERVVVSPGTSGGRCGPDGFIHRDWSETHLRSGN